jgi:malate synthase
VNRYFAPDGSVYSTRPSEQVRGLFERWSITLHEFIQQAAAPGTSISAEAFWSGFAELLRECGTRQLLQVRDELQSRIDQYHRERSDEPHDLGDYERFLRDIGYVLPEGNDFTIRTTNVDDEIAVVAGPQLVVPLSNARYALNAANARWGSLYDALVGLGWHFGPAARVIDATGKRLAWR